VACGPWELSTNETPWVFRRPLSHGRRACVARSARPTRVVLRIQRPAAVHNHDSLSQSRPTSDVAAKLPEQAHVVAVRTALRLRVVTLFFLAHGLCPPPGVPPGEFPVPESTPATPGAPPGPTPNPVVASVGTVPKNEISDTWRPVSLPNSERGSP
jgi:hypothetical protein